MPIMYCMFIVLMATNISFAVRLRVVQQKDYEKLANSIIAIYTREARNVIICARECSHEAAVHSFSYSSNTGNCTCFISVQEANNEQPSLEVSTLEVEPKAGYHGACTHNSECTVTNTECWQGVCECVPGYKWSETEVFCVDDCSTNGLGSTFIGYPGFDLRCTRIGYDVNSLAGCLDTCVSYTNCLSVSYHSELLACMYLHCTPLTHNFTVLSVVTTYIRNCGSPP